MEGEEQSPKIIYDIIILGASGFTGKYVVREALKFLDASSSSPLKTLALAGRNPSKLAQALEWAAHPNPPPAIPILTRIPPTRDPSASSAPKPGSSSTAWAPFASMASLWSPRAWNRAAITWTYAASRSSWREWRWRTMRRLGVSGSAQSGGSLRESGVGEESGWEYGTYESAVLGVANAGKLQEFRRSRPRRARPVIPGPPPPKGPTIEHQKQIGVWAVKLPSADSIVVRRTLSILTENPRGLPGVNESSEQIAKKEAFWSTVKPAHFGVKISSKSLLGIFRIITVGIFIGVFGKTAFGRWLLLKFPSVFSLGWFRKKGPSEDEVRSASFKMWFVGHGFSDCRLLSEGNMKPDSEIITRVMGPEIGYLTTPIILLQCTLIVLSQRDNLPKGGVFPPGIVFGHTDLQQRLQENGISFDVVLRN
ncbi:putative mitochondrial saccharopine dehydrogenase-like oxidoreductase [Vitis vinifera]|uniref:Putative mitochondrial saccharopine dehydrogenase-like oxidoreductase n=1 Tax=Vitis vinifera TaxID=29760 RepID=A0A438H8N1_VITVI|nr:putative mitochondrial saccharopine dehydrogenase-like oxidoreductase [Vitis vinifera]